MLTDTCETLPGVGPTLAQKLQQCGITTITDLLFHFPYRYQDRTRLTPIQDLRINDYCVIAGQIRKTEVKFGKRPMLYCYVADKTGIIRLRFFHFNRQQLTNLQNGLWIRAFGEVKSFGEQIEMIHPEYRLLEEESTVLVEETLTPIYSTTTGLSQTRLRQLVRVAIEEKSHLLSNLEWMRQDELSEIRLPSIKESIEFLHSPPPDVSVESLENGQHPAIQRLIHDELLAQQLSFAFARRHRQQLTARPIPFDESIETGFLKALPFSLTQAQQRVYIEIKADLARSQPMLRLVQGDVGCGKTTIAALAALQAIAQGLQVALMVPTELLSEQHHLNLQRWFSPLGISCLRLGSKMKVKEKRETLAQLEDGACLMVIGTHALFQEHVKFAKLGLIIIDEQHRFGVDQRLQLQQKGQCDKWIPHQLLMTATPIPRTLTMTQFAHLDISIIDELPPGRIPIHTTVIHQDKREVIIERLQAAIAEGKQVYWVCTLIEESEKLQSMAATVTAESLQQQLPKARIGLVHGRLKSVEKEAIMTSFKEGELDLLVATTVIEVGVDVPNASLMIIENAERLGLAQLHQLRGRVGRGNNQSFCLLLYQSPLSQLATERLNIMRATQDGFLIAEKDLELRGGGDMLGTRQTGYRAFKIVDLQRDKHLLPQIRKKAQQLLSETPERAYQLAQHWEGDFEYYLRG